MLGEYLKSLRSELKLSQRALSEKSGVSNAEISRIESGERKRPSEDVLRALALGLNVDVNELIEKANYMYFDSNASRFISREKTNAELYREECEDKFISIITPRILKEGFNMSLVKRSPLGNIMFSKEDYIWRVKFIPKLPSGRALGFSTRILMDTYGYLAIYDELNISKFTIATDDESLYNRLIRKNPIHLDVFISIMLVDLESYRVVDEYKFEKPQPIFY